MSRLGGCGLSCNPVILAGAICVLAATAAGQEIATPPDGGESAAPSTGTLDLLSTPPGVSVEIDGVAEGVTPLVGVVLPPGAHRLRMRGPGLKTEEQTIQILPGQNLHVSVSMPPTPAESPPLLGHGWDVPLASGLLAGSAALLFGVGLGFGIAANDISHQAGVNVSVSGVDLGLTRAQALQGKQYATIANSFYIGAGVVLASAVVVAVVTPQHGTESSSASGAGQGSASSHWGAAWSFW